MRGVFALFDRSVAEQVEDQLGENAVHVRYKEVEAALGGVHSLTQVVGKRSHKTPAEGCGSAAASAQATSKTAVKVDFDAVVHSIFPPGIADQWQPE